MNTDDSEEVMAAGDHAMAYDIVFRGSGNNMRAENIRGNVEIVNTLLPAGTNITVGALYDDKRQRIFHWNYNSNGDHAIYMCTLSTRAIVALVINGDTTDGDVLGFTPDVVIPNIDIIYGDATQGDILYWLNSQLRPCKVNIDRALGLLDDYGVIQASYLDVCKEPPQIPPAVTFEDDVTVTVNNFRKKLMKYKYRYVFDDKDKSVWSAHSEVPLPIGYTDSNADLNADPTKNSRVAIVLQTGKPNVKKIEIAACEGLSNVFSDFFLVKVIDKEADGVDSDTLTSYRFFNDEAYSFIDVPESIQPFDEVPDEANAQTLLNGNVLAYGGIREGQNQITSTATATPATESYLRTTQYPFVFVGSQSANSGFGVGPILVKLIGQTPEDWIFHIYTTNTDITYTALPGDEAADVLAGLAAAAIVLGFTATAGAENLVVAKDGEALARVLVVVLVPYVATDSPAYDWYSVYAYGILYFTDKGKTPGVCTNRDMVVQTIPYSVNTDVPANNLSINHRPPVDAAYFHIVRTKNRSKSDFVQWISDHTYKDAEFAYISIEVLNQYILVNPQSNFLAWEFTAGDRIRFMKLLSNGSGAVGEVYADKDYEIQASLTDPYVNGVLLEGQILKIALPTTDADFDFGGVEWDNYLIEVYTPAKSAGTGMEVYYEFGERYLIGNAGLTTRYHQGMLQNQTADLSQPALYTFVRGDNYFAERTINVGNEIKYSVISGEGEESLAPLGYFLGMTLISSFDVQDYIIAPQEFIPVPAGPATIGAIRVINNSFQFQITGQIKVRLDVLGAAGAAGTFELVSIGDTTDVLGQQIGGLTAGQVLTFDINTTVTKDAIINDGYLNLVILTSVDMEYTVISGYITLKQLGQEYTVGIQNPNYSFNYESAVNSNGRPWSVDPEARENYNPVLMRYGLAYQQDTNINQVNRFFSTNFDEYDRGKGDIRRFKPRERFMRVYQSGGVGQVGIYNQFIKNANGEQQLIYTNQIITQNNIQYYLGEFGMGAGNTALCSNKNADYFDDPVRGYEVRVSNDGMQPISKLYKGQFYISRLISPYNYRWDRPDGTVAKVLKVYDYHEEEAITLLQSGSRTDYANPLIVAGETTELDDYGVGFSGDPVPGDTITITLDGIAFSYSALEGDDVADMNAALIALIHAHANYTAVYSGFAGDGLIATRVSGANIRGVTGIVYEDTISIESYAFSFNEPRNTYSSFLNYKLAEWLLCAEDTLYSWKAGKLYSHTNEVRSNFFGVQYTASITLVFNGQVALKKAFLALALQSNRLWAVPEISTSMVNDQTGLQQVSSLKELDFDVQEGLRYAALKYDANSRLDAREGLNDGDQLNGQWCKCKFQYNGTDYAWMYLPYDHYIMSGRNL